MKDFESEHASRPVICRECAISQMMLNGAWRPPVQGHSSPKEVKEPYISIVGSFYKNTVQSVVQCTPCCNDQKRLSQYQKTDRDRGSQDYFLHYFFMSVFKSSVTL